MKIENWPIMCAAGTGGPTHQPYRAWVGGNSQGPCPHQPGVLPSIPQQGNLPSPLPCWKGWRREALHLHAEDGSNKKVSLWFYSNLNCVARTKSLKTWPWVSFLWIFTFGKHFGHVDFLLGINKTCLKRSCSFVRNPTKMLKTLTLFKMDLVFFFVSWNRESTGGNSQNSERKDFKWNLCDGKAFLTDCEITSQKGKNKHARGCVIKHAEWFLR